jgi:RNA polymerase sigma factor (TIGR02999 family)
MSKANGKQEFDDLYSLIYEELRRLARGVLRKDRAALVSPTTLVHEAWVKLSKAPALASLSPVHFQQLAVRAMRHLLIDAIRRRGAAMHGGGIEHVPFESALDPGTPMTGRVLEEVNAALDMLEMLGPRQARQARVVEAHFFGGLTFAECGDLLGTSEETAKRDWRIARNWLHIEVGNALHLNGEPKDTAEADEKSDKGKKHEGNDGGGDAG